MRTPAVFLPGARAHAVVEGDERAFRHLVVVLRRRTGDAVTVIDGAGGVFRGSIAAIDAARGHVEVAVGAAIEDAAAPVVPLTVAAAVPRGDGMDVAVRLASETGLERIQPLITARTVARPRAGSAKVLRWRRIAVESVEQCGRARPIEVEDPLEWGAYLERLPRAVSAAPPPAWVAVPGGPSPGESGLLHALRGRGALSLAVAVGPEGGFTPAELEAALAAGLGLVGFPTPVQRTPTAVVFVAAWATAALGETS